MRESITLTLTLKRDHTMPSSNRVMVSIPKELKVRLDRIAKQMTISRENGNGYQDVTLTDQGIRGTWVPLASVISRALDELEDHRKRSNKKRHNTTIV